MFIQYQTDNNFSIKEDERDSLSELITKSLGRFEHQITSIQVHLGDENSNKSGQNDKRCVLESRLEGMEPIAVTAHGDTIIQSVRAAIHKLESSLDKRRDRLRTY